MGARAKAWLQAFRLRTLPLALASIFMGSFLAAFEGKFRWEVLTLSALTTIFLQILSNLANDYGDSIHGADSADREGPSRTVQSGLISRDQMKKGMYAFAALSFASGIALLYVALGFNWQVFLFFLGLGVLAIIAAITYTSGSRPYGYAGLGDVSVLLFFGLVGVAGTYFLHANSLNTGIIFPALSCGLMATAVLNVNNIRDIESDRKAGKRSIPVRIGRKKAVVYHGFLLLGAFVSAMIFTFLYYQGPFQWLFVLVLPLLFKNMQAVMTKEQALALDPYLKQMALSTLFFVLAFGIGLLMS